MTQTISYSQLSNWLKCAHYHKLLSVTKEKDFPDNEYTVLGTGAHTTSEKIFEQEIVDDEEKVYSIFDESIDECIEESDIDEEQEKTVYEMAENYYDPLANLYQSVEEEIGEFEVYDTERSFQMSLDDFYDDFSDYIFKGHIDLILKTDKKYWLIDWKTSKSGWGYWHKNTPRKYYQLVLYRYFFHRVENISLEKINSVYTIFNGTEERLDFWHLDEERKSEWKDAIKNIKKLIWNAYERGFYPKNSCCRFCECKGEKINEGDIRRG